MKQPKVKEPVRLRSKPLKDGSESLYLDIYWNGIRQYEFLKLYLIPEATKEAKARNKETLAIATTLKSERIVALQRGEYNFSTADTKIKAPRLHRTGAARIHKQRFHELRSKFRFFVFASQSLCRS